MKQRLIIFPVLFILSLFIYNTSQAQGDPPTEWTVCTACHTIGKGKLIGPDLKGISDRYEEQWLIDFIKSSQTMVKNGDEAAIKIFDEYKIPMPDNAYTDEQVISILNYIKNYQEPAPVETTQATEEQVTEDHVAVDSDVESYGTGSTRTTFIVFLILFLFSLIDLGLTKIIKAKFIHYIIILTSLFVIGEIVYVEAAALGRQHGYSPDQPVWFSHKVHAGQNKIDCMYCHTTAEDSKSAGIPGTDVCMNCHNVVKTGAQTGDVEINKVIDSWNTGKPIEWVRVHNLPDHVFFNHSQHVNAGKRECEECHGPVEEMDRLAQVEDLSMGWCLDCHRKTEVQFNDNGFYKKYVRFHEELNSGKRSKVTVDDIGGNNCQTCHY